MQQTFVIGNDDFARPGVYKTDFYWKPTAADQGTRVVCVEATDTYRYVTSTIHTLCSLQLVDIMQIILRGLVECCFFFLFDVLG